MPIYTNDPCDDGVRPFGHPLFSSVGIGPKVTKAIDAATREWLDDHPEATTTVEDDSITNIKLKDSSVNTRTVEDESITTDKIANLAVTTPKIADNAITAEKIASSAADGLQIMGTGKLGVAKVGAGLAMNDDMLELDGSGDIATAVTSWLNAHPEATTTVQDDSITLRKLASGIVGATKNINVVGVGRYSANNTTGIISPSGSNQYVGMGEMVPCESDTLYVISHSFGTSPVKLIFFYDDNGTYLSRTSYRNSDACTFKTPSDAGFVAVFLWGNGSDIPLEQDSFIQIEKGVVPSEHIEPTTMVDSMARHSIDPIAELFSCGIATTETGGYINPNGSISSPSSTNLEVYTNRIPVKLYERLEWSLLYEEDRSCWVAVATYDEDGNFIERILLASHTTPAVGGIIDDLDGVEYVAFTYRTYGESTFMLTGTPNIEALTKELSGGEEQMPLDFPLRFKPCYDHLFVNDTGSEVVIPHESLYHVRLSRKFGFNVIEANCYSTSDGVWVVNHLTSGGKFGGYFHHVDESTDISDVALSSVTWDWVVQNVRYNSTIPKYRTRPCRIEEFLSECRQQDLIPFVMASDDSLLAIVDGYMGKDNYIAYGASRSQCPSAIIYHWVTRTTKAEILDYCNSVGRPFIYGMANPTAFTDSELRDIIDTLHANGYWIGTSYADMKWHEYAAMGFDVNGTQWRANRVSSGNVCNIESVGGFDEYVTTNATESEGILTFTSIGTITPDIDDQPNGMYVVDIEASYDGAILIPSLGEKDFATRYYSDGTSPFFASIPVVNGNPKVSIEASAGTIIRDMSYKILAV